MSRLKKEYKWRSLPLICRILHTLQSNGSQQDAASSSTADADNQLATPTDFTVDENGSYSFTGVEDAEYYLLYFCDPTATGDDDSYIYTSGPINANSSNTYSGNCADEFSYAFGSYLAKVYAFPDLTDKDYSMSKPATAEYSYSGNQSAPELNYYWNTFDGNMSIQVANLGTYEFEAYPDKVDITFTNTENSADVVALTMENVTPDNNQLDTDALTKGATYDVTAVATSNSEYVLNPTSDTTTVATGLLLGDSSLITDAYSYSDGFANNIFAWPRAYDGFDLENGGTAGYAPAMGGGKTEFVATPVSSGDGSYTYDLAAGNWTRSGKLELKADGTFTAELEGSGPVNFHYPRVSQAQYSCYQPVRWPQRRAQAGRGGGPSGAEPQRAGYLLSHGCHRGLQLGPRSWRGSGQSHGRGSRRAGSRRTAGAGPQHQAQPPLRPRLRVLLRGPLPCGQDGRRLCAGHPIQRHRRLPQALRRQQPGAAPHGVGLRAGRTHPAGDLPDRL